MTISNTASSITHECDGLATDFTFPFPILEEADINVYIFQISTAVTTTLTLGQFTYTGIGEESTGGSVHYPLSGSPLSSDYKLTIDRRVSLTQNWSAPRLGDYDPSTLEKAMDRVVMGLQQVSNDTSAIKVLADDLNGAIDTATAYASQANTSAELAEKWAANPEDSVVVAGEYSALHWAAKAAESAAEAASMPLATISAPGLMSAHDKIKSDGFAFMEDADAVGDGVTDDSTPLAELQDLLPHGGIIRGRAGKSYLLANPPILGPNIRFLGETIVQKPRGRWDFLVFSPTRLIIPSTKTLNLSGAEASGWVVWRQGLVVPTTEAEFYTQLASYAGTAFTGTGDDPRVTNNLFIGFALAGLFSGVFRPEVYENGFDCNAGFEATQVYDCGNIGISFNRGWGYLNANRDWPWATARRPGTAIYIHDGADALKVQGNLSYGHQIGLHLHNVWAVQASHVADNIGSHNAAAAANTIGVKTSGTCVAITLDGCHVDGCADSYKFDHTDSVIQLGSNTCGTTLDRQIALGAGSAGVLGRMTTSGPCVDVVRAAAGVGKWTGEIYTDATASSGRVITFSGGGDNLIGIRFTQPSNLLGNDLSGGAVDIPSIRPHPAIASGLYLPDATSIGISAAGKLSARFATIGAAINHLLVTAQTTGNRVLLTALGGDTNVDMQFNVSGTGALYAGASLLPVGDNARSLGATGARWTSVWAANGTIQTSDPAQKTAIAPVSGEVAVKLLKMIDPITFRWKDGGSESVLSTEEVIEQVTETVIEEVDEIQIVDGRPVLRKVERSQEKPVFDLVDVVGEDGEPVWIDVPAEMRRGKVITPARRIKRQHPVPRMHTVTKSVVHQVAHEGRRTHWGFNAEQVGAVLNQVGVDCGAFVRDEKGRPALRPDQLIPILWAALQSILQDTTSPAIPPHPDYTLGANTEDIVQ